MGHSVEDRVKRQKLGRVVGIPQPSYHQLRDMEIRLLGSGFWVLGSGFWVLDLGFKAQGPGFRVQGLGFSV